MSGTAEGKGVLIVLNHFLPSSDGYWFQTVFQVSVIQLVFVKCRNNPENSERN